MLYNDKASRPNAPVNVIIGALIIKELFDYSDEEIVENLMLDLHLQYALHTTSFAEQPISDKTLSRFRKRCYDYKTLHGVDLYHDCVKDLSSKAAKIMKLNGRIRRMDSIMIESNIRFLSRMELIYTCISKLAVYLTKKEPDMIPEHLMPYADPNDYNRIFYHQSIENEKRRLKTKEDGTMNSSALQNPSDPDASYRNKSGKLYRGYAANLEETVGRNGSVVTDYQFDKNTHRQPFSSGSPFADGKIKRRNHSGYRWGYDGQDNVALAKEKNVRLITTALIGKKAPDALADFEFNEDGTRLLKCATGHEPISQRYVQSEEFSNLARLRNGVETIPANIRKNYHLDKLPRGKQREKFFFGSKIAALNFRKLFGFRKGMGNYAKSPVFA